MKPFKQLSFHDNKILMTFPVYIALLALNAEEKPIDEDNLAAIEFAHVKKFSFDPLLEMFCTEMYSVFEVTLIQLNKKLPKAKKNREMAIKKVLSDIKRIVLKLDDQSISSIHHNMNAFIAHISRVHNNALIDFIFPNQGLIH